MKSTNTRFKIGDLIKRKYHTNNPFINTRRLPFEIVEIESTQNGFSYITKDGYGLNGKIIDSNYELFTKQSAHHPLTNIFK